MLYLWIEACDDECESIVVPLKSTGRTDCEEFDDEVNKILEDHEVGEEDDYDAPIRARRAIILSDDDCYPISDVVAKYFKARAVADGEYEKCRLEAELARLKRELSAVRRRL